MRLEIKSCVGLGDLILVYSQTEQIKDQYSEIAICPEYDLLRQWRLGSKESYEFTKKFAQILFSGPPYVLIESSNYPLTDPHQLTRKLGLKNKYVNLSGKLCLPKVDIGTEDYVVVNTKVRQIPPEHFKSIKNRFFDVLRHTNKSIVVLGERDLGVNRETKFSQIYTMYSDLKEALKDINHIDLTKEVLLDYPDIDNLKKDMTIIRDAKCAVGFGISGIVTLTATVANSMLGYRTDTDQYFTDFNDGITNGKITNNFDDFIGELCRKIL